MCVGCLLGGGEGGGRGGGELCFTGLGVIVYSTDNQCRNTRVCLRRGK